MSDDGIVTAPRQPLLWSPIRLRDELIFISSTGVVERVTLDVIRVRMHEQPEDVLTG